MHKRRSHAAPSPVRVRQEPRPSLRQLRRPRLSRPFWQQVEINGRSDGFDPGRAQTICSGAFSSELGALDKAAPLEQMVASARPVRWLSSSADLGRPAIGRSQGNRLFGRGSPNQRGRRLSHGAFAIRAKLADRAEDEVVALRGWN